MIGPVITYGEAAAIAGRDVRTIYRWAAAGLVRQNTILRTGEAGVEMSDVQQMMNRKWTRKARPPES